jgi:PAS domain S-box-containing protein
VVAGVFFHHGQSRRLMEKQRFELAAIADLKIHEIETWRRERLGDARHLSSDPFLAAALVPLLRTEGPPSLRRDAERFLDGLNSAYGYRLAAILDARGRTVLLRSRSPGEGLDATASRRAAAAAARGEIVFGELAFRDGDQAHLHLDILIPLRGNDAKAPAEGVLLLCIEPADYLFPLVQSWPTPSPSSETLLVRKEGDEVVFLNELRHRRGTALRLRFPVSDPDLPAARAARGETGEFQGLDYRGVPVLSAVRPISGSSWFIVAKTDLAEIRAPLRRQSRLMVVVVVLMILASGFGLGWLERRSQAELHRKAEAEIRKSHEILSGVQESTEAMIFSLDRDLRYTSFNSGHATAMKALYGTEIKPGMWLFDAMTVAEDRRAARANLERVLQGESSTVESYSGDDDLIRRYFQITHNPIRSEAGDIVGIVVVSSDITARKKVEEEVRRLNADLERRVAVRTAQLEAANAELEAFSYSVSHDLRAPLRVIDGFSQAILEEHDRHLDEQGRVFLRRIRANAQDMGCLIDDMLKLARVTKADLHIEEVDLSALADRAAAALAVAHPERTVNVVIPSGLTAWGDARLLRVVLDNLFENAWKFTARRSDARIEFGRVASAGGAAYFVRDNGVGFEMAYVGKLFAPFQRLHAKDEFPGTGIGLATVQRIIHRHGGRTWAESAAGEGAVFYFTIDIGKERPA